MLICNITILVLFISSCLSTVFHHSLTILWVLSLVHGVIKFTIFFSLHPIHISYLLFFLLCFTVDIYCIIFTVLLTYLLIIYWYLFPAIIFLFISTAINLTYVICNHRFNFVYVPSYYTYSLQLLLCKGDRLYWQSEREHNSNY